MEIKLNVVNKTEYAENHNYREIIIRLPKSDEELKKDFEYLGLDYNNLSIQDSHILQCEFIDNKDPHFSGCMTSQLTNIIERATDSGWTTPYQDIKNMFELIKSYDGDQRDKLLSVLEFKKEQITNMADAVKFGKHINWFAFYYGINTSEDYAKELIRARVVNIDDLVEYLDLEHLGDDLCKRDNAQFTELGLIFENTTHASEEEYEEEEEEY